MNQQVKRSGNETRAEEEATARLLAELKAVSIKYGSPEHEHYLAAGYPDIGSRAHALELLSERKKNPAAIPWDVMKRAEAFLAALDYKPEDHPALVDPNPYVRQS